ncbi:MAG TPA: hypothetical protein VGH02_03020 [Rhizomicrobium sp.]
MRILRQIARALVGFHRANGGTSAVEFGLVLPLLAVAAVSISDASTISTQSSAMQSAVRASIQYAMNGGGDTSVAQQTGVQAWNNKPSDGTLLVSQSCVCGGAAGTCGTVCADGTVPSSYVTAVATGKVGGDVLSWHNTVTESVRVQ